MNLRTAFPVSAPPPAWAALADPARVAAALPGCRSVEAVGDGSLAVVLDLSVASVSGLWSGTVSPVDADTVRIAGSGAPGTVDLTARAEGDRTRLTVEGEVSGPLATVGSTVLAAAVRHLAGTLFARLAGPDAPSLAAPSAGDPGAAVRQRGPAGAVAAAAVVTGAVAVVRWRRRRSAQ